MKGTLMLTRKPDSRFLRHGTQPRGKYLDRRQRALCKIDPAFLMALQPRVSNPDRWRAFMDGVAYFTGRTCARCHSTHRRVYNGACYGCMLNRNRRDFQLIRSGIHPPANQSREGWLDIQARRKREHSGECLRYEVGPYVAEQFPTGRVRLIAPHMHIDTPDLQQTVSAERLYNMAVCDPAFQELLQRLGWA